MQVRTIISECFNEVMEKSGHAPLARFDDEMILLESGLDSLGFAILITTLEQTLGYDPFTLMEDPFYPRTFQELVAVYDKYRDQGTSAV